jgi:hypothetical protein
VTENDSGQTSPIPDVSDAGRVIKAHYDVTRKCYWVENSRGGWIEINETSLRRRLRGYGLRKNAAEGELLSEVD